MKTTLKSTLKALLTLTFILDAPAERNGLRAERLDQTAAEKFGLWKPPARLRERAPLLPHRD